jgi:hypothetical protein
MQAGYAVRMASTTPKSRAKTTQSTNRARSTAARAQAKPAPEPTSASKLRGPLIAGGAAIVGIAGGMILGAKTRPRKRRVPSLPSVDLSHVNGKKTRKQVASASKQFGAFTRELRKAGEQAERLGNALD